MFYRLALSKHLPCVSYSVLKIDPWGDSSDHVNVWLSNPFLESVEHVSLTWFYRFDLSSWSHSSLSRIEQVIRHEWTSWSCNKYSESLFRRNLGVWMYDWLLKHASTVSMRFWYFNTKYMYPIRSETPLSQPTRSWIISMILMWWTYQPRRQSPETISAF